MKKFLFLGAIIGAGYVGYQLGVGSAYMRILAGQMEVISNMVDDLDSELDKFESK